MKKSLIILVGIISLFGISEVKAESFSYTYHNNNYSPAENASFYVNYSSIISSLYDEVYSVYFSDYVDLYPYYIIYIDTRYGVLNLDAANDTYLSVILYAYSSLDEMFDVISITGTYNNTNHSIVLPVDISTSVDNVDNSIIPKYFSIDPKRNRIFIYFFSNFRHLFSDYFEDSEITISNIYDFDSSSTKTNTYSLNDEIPDLQELLGLDIISDSNSSTSLYTEINLNNYSYVALSLKDYTERDDFYTNVEVQGQYCLTPVYNYGLTEKKDVMSGYRTQSCSPYYNSFTPIRTYILESDIKNHAIYYIKAFDTSRDNIIKVDTSVFNIHLITSEEEDNPILNINGRNYSAIPYDSLSDSATVSEEEGYVSGASCAIGDFNCSSQYAGGFSFSDIFNKPLEVLKDVWTSIEAVFSLVSSLISILPEPMQYFLYAAFMLAIILGIIKIVL